MDLPPPPPVAEVQKIELDDLFNDNPLYDWVRASLDKAEGDTYEEQLQKTLESLPEPTADLYVIFLFDGTFDEVILGENLGHRIWFIGRTRDAHERFGSDAMVDYLENLAKKAKSWSARAVELEAKDAPDEEWEPFWNELEKESEVYDTISTELPNPYEGILKKIKKEPEAFVRLPSDKLTQ